MTNPIMKPTAKRNSVWIVLFLALTPFTTLQAQWTFSDATTKWFESFRNAPLVVQLTGCRKVDDTLRESIMSRWQQGTVVYSDEIDQSLIGTERYPAVLRFSMMHLTTETQGKEYYLNSWQVVVPERNKSKFDPRAMLACSVSSCFPLDICSLEGIPSRCVMDVELAIVRLNDVVSFLKTSGFSKSSRNAFQNIPDFCRAFNAAQNLGQLASKPLLVNRSTLSGTITPEEFQKLYPFPHEIVDDASFWTLVNARKEGYLYLFSTDVPGLAISIHDMSSMQTIYVDAIESENGSLTTRFQVQHVRDQVKRLAKAVRSSR